MKNSFTTSCQIWNSKNNKSLKHKYVRDRLNCILTSKKNYKENAAKIVQTVSSQNKNLKLNFKETDLSHAVKN